MRIGYLLNTYPQPSVTFIRREVQALERRGVEVHRFAMRSDRAGLVDPADIAEYGRTELVLAAGGRRLLADTLRLLLRRPAAFRGALASAWRMGGLSARGRLRHLIYLAEAAHVTRRADELGLEHLHAHFGTNPAAVVALIRRLGGPGYSFTVHGPEEFDSPQALSLAEKVGGADLTVAISSHGRSQLMRWAAYRDWPRIAVVHCGIEPARFPEPAPMPPGPPDGPLRLVCIGRFVEQKGQLLLPEAMAIARRRGVDVHLTLVGDGAMRTEIEAAIAAHGVGDAVSLTGWLDEAGVRRALSESHALVLPSFAEGLPMVVMEAMAGGRAVIATHIAGNPELVVPGQTGWLVPAGDVEALAEGIRLAASTPAETLVQMGLAGRARVLQRHDIDREAARLARLIEETIRR
ncbi:glycosyltransferase family 4 protein [Paracoccus marinaquae]|uniref:Glycosyltransferase family 4 protein n=1 Tax=Paracoccus marinaquae TaxID=2841926 RepID=A0ABS6AHA0_9RHOB|nr:glycosyltransferase family 4 protein [Paracoccus marinaquae]MBU3029972.1 glycosyltransferase family 4 protein [Paracoccus marinaquae]